MYESTELRIDTMRTLRKILEEAKQKKIAVGHFNISDLAGFKAITATAKELDLPILIGVSEGEREFVGVAEAAALVKAMRESYGQEVYLNADHTHSLEKIEAAVRAGFDEVIADFSELPFDANVKQTRAAVELAKSINPNVLVEGEIGWIGSGSEIHDKAPENIALSTVEEAKQFIAETKVDILAPAVGTMHGLTASMASGSEHKRLNIERIKEIREAIGIFMTLHGGSGTADDDFVAGVKAGLTIVHVNTEIRIAWRKGVEAGLAKDAHEVAPYKILLPAVADVKEVVKNRLKLFSGL